jgi:hypothetical protein
LEGHVFDVLTLAKPVSVEAAVNLVKVISKLSPLLGNLIEINTVEVLNAKTEFRPFGKWIRQDPDFPDTILQGGISPVPGFEIKAWFPLATEITARFKDSQRHFIHDNTGVVILAWLPERLIYGKPKIIGVCVVSGKSVAAARDLHYHNPPGYVVIEPEDTKQRTRNLRQTNTNGYKFQGTGRQLLQAAAVVRSWGPGGKNYKPTPDYQSKLRMLTSRFPYRLDTNFAKIDRIEHAGIEAFKKAIGRKRFFGMPVNQWGRVLAGGDDSTIRGAIKLLGIKDSGARLLVR